MGKLNWAKQAGFALLLCAATAIALPAQTSTAPQRGSITPIVPNETVALPAQTFETLQSFDLTDGATPYAVLVQGTDGNLYGTTSYGGAQGCGTVFKITAAGALTTLHSFHGTDGINPNGLLQGANGTFYGTTDGGGPKYSYGTVFKITPGGTLATLYSFCSQSDCTDGLQPYAGLVQATDGNFYGTTWVGGHTGYISCPYGCGTVFKIAPSGTLTTLYRFCSQSACRDGTYPGAGLVQATDGNLYGTTALGGANNNCAPYTGCGTIFKITPSGTLTTLYSFCSESGCTDGFRPEAGLVQATNGNFYGTTYYGGAKGNISCPYGCGTVFEITPGGTLTTLYSFCSKPGCADGSSPSSGLVQATDGNLYGTTDEGGANSCIIGGTSYGCGTVFKIIPSGTLTTLYSFCSQNSCADGSSPSSGLVQDTNGKFYGTTSGGGANNDGTVFSLSVGLGPFVETQPTSGSMGEAVKILGTNLAGATRVMFNGHAAVFSVVSNSLITTTVPAGATTGLVEVVTPSGTLLSNAPFRVPPSFSPGSPSGDEGGD
jgi:uncharacterized repeat protein (TIGR03803 family)